MEVLIERLDEIEKELSDRAFLYDDPVVYREAIDTTLRRVRLVISGVTGSSRTA
jgi:hypothetical protein